MTTRTLSRQLCIGEHEILARRMANRVNDLDDQAAVARFLAEQPLDRATRKHKGEIWKRAKILRLENGLPRSK
jgi:hypothetical protein